MAKQSKPTVAPVPAVRTRRAYFDCRFGQLHVRTAFPTTGGFDEQVTLLCLHSGEGSSRMFARFLGEIAEERSVYAPDLPGCGESDPAPSLTFAEAASAVSDLAADLRLRRIDILGYQFGAGAALELAVSRPEFVRRLVLVAPPPIERLPLIHQNVLLMRLHVGAPDDMQWAKRAMPKGEVVELSDYAGDLFDAAPKTLAKQIRAFLDA